MNEAESLFQETQRAHLHRELSRFTRENSAKVSSLEVVIDALQLELEEVRQQERAARDRETRLRDKIGSLVLMLRGNRSHASTPAWLRQLIQELEMIANTR